MKTGTVERLTVGAREQLVCTGPIELLAAKDEKDQGQKKTQKIRMLGYTGASVRRWYGMAVFDLAGMTPDHPERLAILYDHLDPIGAGAYEIKKDRLEVEGEISLEIQAARDIAVLSRDTQFPWQSSVGLIVDSIEQLEPGVKSEVNGREVMGPLTIIRQSRLYECSVVAAGADKNTSAELASAKENSMTTPTMTPESFAKLHPQAVEAWRKEGADGARASLKETLAILPQTFAGRFELAATSWLEGKSPLEAKAALADKLALEVEDERKARAAAEKAAADKAEDKKVLEELKGQARDPGVGFSGKSRQDPQGGEGLSLEERAKRDWDKDEKLRAEFFDSFSAYLAMLRREQAE